MTVTVVKTIGTTGTFSTLQLWEDGAPTDLTTAEKSAATTFLIAAFAQGESLTFVGSGATGKLLDTDSTGAGTGTYVTYGITAGNPAASDVVTGGTSGATCVLTSGTPTDTGVIWQGQAQNENFTAAVTVLSVSGTTTSSSAYKHLTTVAGASFRDNVNAQTNALRYNSSNGASILGGIGSSVVVAEANFRMSNFMDQGPAAAGALSISGATAPIFEFCIFESGTTAANAITGGSSGSGKFKNCLIVLRASAKNSVVNNASSSVDYYNCTIVAVDDLATAPAKVVSVTSGTCTLENCSLFAGDSTKAVVGDITSGSATFTTCYSDISGTTGVTQCTYTSEFQDVNDATRDYRLKTGAAELDVGTTDSTNAPNDIVGTARPQGSAYDVGCWELVVAAGGDTLFGQICL